MKKIKKRTLWVVNNKMKFISALAAIPKKDWTIRLIHDASQPNGGALNDCKTA